MGAFLGLFFHLHFLLLSLCDQLQNPIGKAGGVGMCCMGQPASVWDGDAQPKRLRRAAMFSPS